MARPLPVSRMTYEEYLAAEEKAEVRHEFLNGEVFAMAGGTPAHGALAAAFMGELRNALRDRPCRPFSSDVRVRIPETGLTTYPDLSVVCGGIEVAPEDRNAITNPILIVEVLSEATEAYDRGAKAQHYRRIASLREYVLVSQQEARIEVHRRNERGIWEIHDAREGEAFELVSIGARLDVRTIYEDPLGRLIS